MVVVNRKLALRMSASCEVVKDKLFHAHQIGSQQPTNQPTDHGNITEEDLLCCYCATASNKLHSTHVYIFHGLDPGFGYSFNGHAVSS